MDEVVDTYFLSWWKMYAFILSQTNLYCDLCFIIYVLDIVCFWQFFPVSDRFFFSLLEVRKAYISVLVFTFALLVVISLSYHTKSSYLSISIYSALTASLHAHHYIRVWRLKKVCKEKEKDHILNCCKLFNLLKSTLKMWDSFFKKNYCFYLVY